MAKPALTKLHDMMPGSSAWNTNIMGVVNSATGARYNYTFGQLASSGRFPSGVRIGNAFAFESSVNSFHDALSSSITNNPDATRLVASSRSALLQFVGGLANRPYGTKQSITPQRGEMTPEQEAEKYNPRGTAVTRPGTPSSDLMRAVPAPPLGVKIPFPDQPYTMLYNPVPHKLGERQRKILRKAEEMPVKDNALIPPEIKDKFTRLGYIIKQAHIPSPEEFLNKMADESVPLPQRMEYASAVLARSRAVNQKINTTRQEIFQGIMGDSEETS